MEKEQVLFVSPDRILLVKVRRFNSDNIHKLYLTFGELRRLKNKSRRHYIVSVTPVTFNVANAFDISQKVK